MSIENTPQYSYTSALYQDVTEAVFDKKPFKFFRQQYHILTSDHEETKYPLWIDYLLDRYNCYKSAGFYSHESEINSLMDGLEQIINQLE
jgi:hypothetical protein